MKRASGKFLPKLVCLPYHSLSLLVGFAKCIRHVESELPGDKHEGNLPRRYIRSVERCVQQAAEVPTGRFRYCLVLPPYLT
jgi:hypothetical protein